MSSHTHYEGMGECPQCATGPSTADFTADELATLARFDATPAAPESWGGGLREGLAEALCDADADQGGFTWEEATPGSRDAYRVLADAALTVLAAHLGQQQAAIDRVKALADEWERDSEADYAAGIGSAINRRAASRRIRDALGADL